MFDILKKTFLVGVGATVVTKERIESSLNELVDKGKISAEEARKTADKIADEGKAELEQFNKQFDAAVEDAMHRARFATTKQVAELESRITALEVSLAEAKKAQSGE